MNLNIFKYLNLKKKVNNTLRKKNNLTNYTAQAIKHKKNNTKIKYKIKWMQIPKAKISYANGQFNTYISYLKFFWKEYRTFIAFSPKDKNFIYHDLPLCEETKELFFLLKRFFKINREIFFSRINNDFDSFTFEKLSKSIKEYSEDNAMFLYYKNPFIGFWCGTIQHLAKPKINLIYLPNVPLVRKFYHKYIKNNI